MKCTAKIGDNFQLSKINEDNFQLMGSILSRIEQISKNESVTITFIEKQIGASKGVLSRAINNNTDIQSKWIQKIVENYPLYNPGWLLTGEGEMLRDSGANLEVPVAHRSSTGGIPLIPVSAMAGFGEGEVGVLDLECDRYVVPLFKDAEFLIQVRGGSMYPKYSAGDVVACKKLPLKDLFFQWNKVYVLDTVQGPLVKRVKKGTSNECITIVSDNPDYDQFELPIKCIYSIAIVIGVIRLE